MSTNQKTVETLRKTIYGEIVQDIHPWVVGFSGYKDSTEFAPDTLKHTDKNRVKHLMRWLRLDQWIRQPIPYKIM